MFTHNTKAKMLGTVAMIKTVGHGRAELLPYTRSLDGMVTGCGGH